MGLSQAIDDIMDIMEERQMPISINTENDIVYVFQAHDGSWRWHRVDTNNGQVVVQGGHPYNSQDYAWAAAVAYNPGLIVEHGE